MYRAQVLLGAPAVEGPDADPGGRRALCDRLEARIAQMQIVLQA